jgi:hypothetical protein
MPRCRGNKSLAAAVSLAVCAVVRSAFALDVQGILPAAADMPQTHVYLQPAVPNGSGGTMPGNILEVDDGFGDTVYDIQGFLDTGTSGVLLSLETQQGLGVQLQNGVTFNDVAVGGNDSYNVSTQYYLSAAPFSADNDVQLGNNPPDTSAYSPVTGPIAMQTNQQPADDLLGPIDVFGTPVMQGKVMVLDIRPANDTNPDDLGETRTYLYAPGTPFNTSTEDTNPGIPTGQLHVKVSSANFGQFTQLQPTSTPASEGPQQSPNPMIGPDPVTLLNTGKTDNTPPIRITFGGKGSTGSFIFDTGGQVSFISTAEAQKLGVEYATDAQGNQLLDSNGDPYLVSTSAGHATIANQFNTSVGGAGGASVDAAGFYLDKLSLPTMEGDPITFDGAPVLVFDFTVQDPNTGKTLTLDGDFGMSYVEPSATLDFGQENAGAFDWATYDQPNGQLGFTLSSQFTAPVVIPTGTTVSAATDAAIGTAGGDVSLYGGTLAVTGSFFTTRALAVSLTGGTISFASPATLTVNPSTLTWAGGTLNVNNAGTLAFALTGNDVSVTRGATLSISPTSTVVVGGSVDPFSDPIFTANHVAVVNNGSLAFNTSSVIAGLSGSGKLTVGNGSSAATLQIAPGAGSNSLSSLLIGTGSTLDLANNRLIINYAGSADPIATIRQYIQTGFNGGLWNGTGISSSSAAANSGYALGYADGADGVVAGLPSGQIEVMYTLYGDANLDGKVNGADFAIVAANFNKAVSGWDKGDFTYDQKDNGADFALLAAHFNQGATGAAVESAAGIAALDAFAAANGLPLNVPEPASGAMLTLAATALATRLPRRKTPSHPS